MADFGEGLNCTAQHGSITVDSDIVGPGVLAAFFMTAIITIGAVIFGYLSDSLGDESMNDLDREVIKWSKAKTRDLKASVRNILGRPISLSADSDSENSEARKKAVTQFILTLSDQQLVTGLAILISGIANQKQLTIYEFSVVLCLAWFSSTTHLATLDVLRTYLRTHGIIREIRVCGMVSVLILLLYAFFVTILSSSLKNTVPVQCVFSTHAINSHTSGMDSLAALSIVSWVFALLLIVSGYCVRIWNLYLDHETLPRFSARISNWLSSGKERSALVAEPQLSPDEYLTVLRAASRAKNLRFLLKVPRQIRQVIGGSHLLGGSFLSSLTGIAFSFSYGTSQVVLYRWETAPSLEAGTDSMGFGQIMALFLLVLPFLAAGECYFDYAEKRSRDVSTDDTSTQSRRGASREDSIDRRVMVTVDDGSDAQTVRVEYARCRDDMTKYLASDIYTIRNLETQHTTLGGADQSLLDERKRAVLLQYQKLKKCEEDITIASAVLLFFVNLAVSAALGVLLNLATTGFSVALSATIIFISLFGSKIVDATIRVYKAGAELAISDTRPERQQEQMHRGEGTEAALT